MLTNKGYLIISLDFELLWGVFDLEVYRKNNTYFANTRKVIPKILERFEQYEVHATWAVVGMLFNNGWEEWKTNRPKLIPTYADPALSAYDFGDSIAMQQTENLVFAPDLIQRIKNTQGQEIGTHTYSHYYCLEQGQSEEQFAIDLQKAVEAGQRFNIKIKSLIFPRNQLKREYLKICFNLGIENVRSNPSSWYWQNTRSTSFLTKIARSGDAYFPWGKKSYAIDSMKIKNGMPLEQKASRFLRPADENKLLRKLKLNRILREMTLAAKNKEIYHLWWHPHNFGDRPSESLNDLELILDHFKELQKKYDFQSGTMEDIGKLVFTKSI